MLSSWISHYLFKVEQDNASIDDAAIVTASRRRYAYMVLATALTCAMLSLELFQLPSNLRSNNLVGLIFAIVFAALVYFLGKTRSPTTVSVLTSILFICGGFYLGVGLHETRIWDRDAGAGTMSTFILIVSILLLAAATAASTTLYRFRNVVFIAGAITAAIALALLIPEQPAKGGLNVKGIVSSSLYVAVGMFIVKLDDEIWRNTVAEAAEGPVGLDRALGAKAASLLLLFAATSILYLMLQVFVIGF